MEEVTMIGIDLAKNVFQLHGATAEGQPVFRRKLTRPQFQRFMAAHPACTVAMEACPGAHYWAREMERLGHTVKMISPHYVTPYVKRQKNDAADAEAIAEAATRPHMRFVEPKSADQQSRAVVFRVRQMAIAQRTELVNALRSHLYEFGYIAPVGVRHLPKLIAMVEDERSNLPGPARPACRAILRQIESLDHEIRALDAQIAELSKESHCAELVQTMSGVGPITAMAIEAFAPPMESFKRGRDFAAWLGLVPRQNSSGGKARLGKVSKAGQHDIRRLLIVGAMSAIVGASRRGISENTWLGQLMLRKPRMLAAIALANKMARRIWAMITKGESYRDPALAMT
ncbi:IS110 family transposase [Salipiger mucosus]|nr:IS110 family transposase [Salipiger mucosus]